MGARGHQSLWGLVGRCVWLLLPARWRLFTGDINNSCFSRLTLLVCSSGIVGGAWEAWRPVATEAELVVSWGEMEKLISWPFGGFLDS